MRARESVKNYSSALREMSNYSVRSIKKICEQIGPRPAGSERETEALKLMAKELEDCCGRVGMQEFDVRPGAFLGWLRVAALMMTASIVLFFFGQSAASLALTLLSLFFAAAHFLLQKKVLAPLFAKKTSHNVLGVRESGAQAQRRIIFYGHCDSSDERRFNYLAGSAGVATAALLSLAGAALGLVLSIWAVARGYAFEAAHSGALYVLRYVYLAWLPVFFALLFFENKRPAVEGANSSLTGCLAATSVLRFMQRHDIRLENTEIWVLLTGSDEVGLCGARAFCAAHRQQLGELETIFIGFDTLHSLEHMSVSSKDGDICALVQRAGETAGLSLPVKSTNPGDAGASVLSKAGLKAATIRAADPARARCYRTRLDTRDKLEPQTIEAAVDLALETAFRYDEKGLEI